MAVSTTSHEKESPALSVDGRTPALPTAAELAAAEEKMQEAFDEVEAVKVRLSRVINHPGEQPGAPEGVVVDDAYVGLLYRRVSDFDRQHWQIGRVVRECRELLEHIDFAGRDDDLRRSRLELEAR